MPTDSEPTPVISVDRMAKFVALISAIVGISISANTFISSKAKENTDRYAAFRTAVSAEEKSWRDLYDDYLRMFEKDEIDNDTLRQKKLFALQAIALRDIASFSEFKVDEKERSVAQNRIRVIRDALLTSLSDGRTSDADTAAELRKRTFVAERAAAAAPAADPGASATPSAALDAAKAPAVDTLSPETSNGWAVDVFWCSGGGVDADANYRSAYSLGTALAAFANANRPLAPGIPIGKVQVQRADPGRWAQIGLAPGRYVIRDNGAGEVDAGEALLALVNDPRSTSPRFSRAISGGKPTPWYISLWVCPTPSARPAAS